MLLDLDWPQETVPADGQVCRLHLKGRKPAGLSGAVEPRRTSLDGFHCSWLSKFDDRREPLREGSRVTGILVVRRHDPAAADTGRSRQLAAVHKVDRRIAIDPVGLDFRHSFPENLRLQHSNARRPLWQGRLRCLILYLLPRFLLLPPELQLRRYRAFAFEPAAPTVNVAPPPVDARFASRRVLARDRGGRRRGPEQKNGSSYSLHWQRCLDPKSIVAAWARVTGDR
jgi:hypothetical protein